MTLNYATLLAQLIPVIALAVGFELRASTLRFEQQFTHHDSRDSAMQIGVVIVVMCLVQTILTTAEVYVLTIARGETFRPMSLVWNPGGWQHGGPLSTILSTAIEIAFLAPAIEALLRIIVAQSSWTRTEERRRIALGLALIFLFFIVLLPAVGFAII
jgi:hypothetical protein